MKKSASEKSVATKTILGWNELVDLPDWGIRGLRAKMDTGARSSSLDVDFMELLPGGRIRFDVILSGGKRPTSVSVKTKVARFAHVTSSPRDRQKRPFVRTRVRIGHVLKEIELNLFDRSGMNYRMLLGRTALARDFLVDAGRSGMLQRKRRQS